MALFLTSEQVRQASTMDDCLKNCRTAYQLLGKAQALNRPRSQLHLNVGLPGIYYLFKSMEGAIPELGVAAIRMTSQMAHWHEVDGILRKEKQTVAKKGYLVGLIMLFDMKTCRLLCIMPDGIVDRLRVGATNALAAEFLARKDCRSLGLLGTGNHARTQVLGFTLVRQLSHIKVFSPNADHRKRFCQEMSALTDVEIKPVSTPEEAVADADIVAAATNSREPVLRGKWARPGVHYSSILPYEPDQTLVNQAEVFIVNTRNPRGDNYTLTNGEKFPYYDSASAADYETLPELAEVVAGLATGRSRDNQITLFVNNMGLGIQFAATANAIYREAKRQGVGTEISDEFFLQEEHA